MPHGMQRENEFLDCVEKSMQNKIGDSSVLRRTKEIIARKIDEETILVPVAGNLAKMQRIYALNPVAARIWDLIDAGTSVTDIVSVLTSEFEVDRETAYNDAVRFLGKLVEEGLVSVSYGNENQGGFVPG